MKKSITPLLMILIFGCTPQSADMTDDHNHGQDDAAIHALHDPTQEAVDDCCAVEGTEGGQVDTASHALHDPTQEGVDDCCATEELHADDGHVQGGIAVPPAVRENLGITFATVERRTIAQSRRVPGIFEFTPKALHEYRALLTGRITLHVEQFQRVQKGDLLFTINSPQWREIQHAAVEAEGEITMAEAMLDVTRARRTEAQSSLSKLNERLGNLSAAGVRNASIEAQVTELRSSMPRFDAEVRAQEAALAEAHEHYLSRLRTLSSVTGISIDLLTEPQEGAAAWRAITELEVRTLEDGTVQEIGVNDGGWLNEGDLALTTVDPTAIRFHAEAPQTDIALFRDGQSARIVPSRGSSVDLQTDMTGTVSLGLAAHVEDRTISLYTRPDYLAPWARAGVSAFLEITVTDQPEETWAIPSSAVIQDGLEHVYFRRDPENPDRVLRVVADLGESDGRWVALRSGVKSGDEVVLDGAYALKLTDSGAQAPEGYHYHADGSLHKDH